MTRALEILEEVRTGGPTSVKQFHTSAPEPLTAADLNLDDNRDGPQIDHEAVAAVWEQIRKLPFKDQKLLYVKLKGAVWNR